MYALERGGREGERKKEEERKREKEEEMRGDMCLGIQRGLFQKIDTSQSSSFCRHHKALWIFNRHGFVMSKVKQNFCYYLMSHHEDP